MKAYTPVVIGETAPLRESVEGMLSPYSDSISNRLEELDAATITAGNSVTFGAEIEFQFIDNPTASVPIDKSPQRLYEDVVMSVLDTDEITQPAWGKGDVILPLDNPNAIMLSGKYSDQGGDIIEVQTSPTNALEAIEYYWRVVRAIGSVAQAHGKMGLILTSHLSTVVGQQGIDQPFVVFHEPHGGGILANIQHNLQAVSPLQIDAGLETGVAVLEAYPTKDASTAIHDERLEFRHGSVGIIDPRVDMLAVVDGVRQRQLGGVQAAQGHLRKSSKYMWDGPWVDLVEVLNDSALVDNKTQRLVMPAMLDSSARADGTEWAFSGVGELVTGERGYAIRQDNGDAIRTALAGLSLGQPDKSFWQAVEPSSVPDTPIAEHVRPLRAQLLHDVYRTLPYVIFDSPESHARRRSNLGRSSTVRRILGQAGDKLTKADEAIAIRNDLISAGMVVSDDIAWLDEN